MAKPYHAKVLTLFPRIMAEDNSTYKDLFRPDAERVLWFGADCGKVGKPADALPFPRKGGPMKYYNRVQYFGDHVFAETHDAVYEENDDRVHPKLKGCSMPVLAVCQLDDEGYITRFEEFADPSYLAAGKRPIPAPVRPPNEVRTYKAPGDPVKFKEMAIKTFDKIMKREDMADLFSKEAVFANWSDPKRKSATAKGAQTNWEGTYSPIGFNKKGELRTATGKPNLHQYTNRRQLVGDGWAIEMHTANIAFNPKHPDNLYTAEVGVLLQVDEKDSSKFRLLEEWADPGKTKRVPDPNALPDGTSPAGQISVNSKAWPGTEAGQFFSGSGTKPGIPLPGSSKL